MKTLAQPGDKADIVRRLRTVRQESGRRWGKMSAHQMVCHLSDAFLCVVGQKPVSHASGVLSRTVVKWFALYAPIPWPPGILTRPEIDQQVGGTRPGDFAADVVRVEALVDLITADAKCFEGQLHPIFGRMSDADWLRWGYLHMDHHLRQFGA